MRCTKDGDRPLVTNTELQGVIDLNFAFGAFIILCILSADQQDCKGNFGQN